MSEEGQQIISALEDAVASAECDHVFEPTAVDENGEPDFRPNRQMWSGEKAHVVCTKCNVRTWLSRDEWDALEESE